MKFLSTAIATLLSLPSVDASYRRLHEHDDLIPLTIRAGIVPGATPVFLNRGEDGSFSGYLIDFLEIIRSIAMEDSATPFHYNVTYDFVVLEGLPNVSTYNGAQATVTDGCDDYNVTDGVGCLDMLVGDYFITSERTQILSFPPQPFANAPVVGFYSTSGPTYTDINEVNAAGGTVCVLENSAVGSKYEPFIENPVLCGPNIPACVERVSTGECDFGFGGSIFVSYAQQMLPDIVQTGPPVPDGTLEGELQFYVSIPLRSSLNPVVLQNINIWADRASSKIPELLRTYFGQETLNLQIAQRDAFYRTNLVTLRAAVMVYPPYVDFDESGELIGYSVEHLNSLVDASNGQLTVEWVDAMDPNGDGVFSNPGNVYNPSGTYNDAIEALSASPFDIIVGPFASSVTRQEHAAFDFRFLWQEIVLFRLFDSSILTVEEANAQNPPLGVCILDGTLVTDPKSNVIANPVSCSTVDDCYRDLANGECGLMVDWVLDGFVNAANAIPDLSVTISPFDEEMLEEFQDGFFYSYPMRRDLPPSSYERYNEWNHQVRDRGTTIELADEFFYPFFPMTLFEGDDGKEMMETLTDFVDEDIMRALEIEMNSDTEETFETSSAQTQFGTTTIGGIFLFIFSAFFGIA